MVKLSIIGGSLYFIYNKIVRNNLLNFSEFVEQLRVILFQNSWTIPLLLTLTFFNWFFEIWKWKILTNTIKKNALFEATKQSLSALTTSLFTPNRIGDYGAKALYFPKNKWKAMALNLIGNLNQLTVTILFGIAGLIYFLSTYEVEINAHRLRRVGYLIALLIIIPFTNKRLKLIGFLKGDSTWNFVKQMSLDAHLAVFIFSLIRYIIFSHQFYYLLMIFGIDIDYSTLMYLIFTMYFLASFIPSISLFDWAIKGSVAIYIFAFAGISEITIVTITLLMWILNFAIPAIIGSFFVVNFKFSKE